MLFLASTRPAARALLPPSRSGHVFSSERKRKTVQGEAFYEAMQLSHEAATRTMNQIREYVKENGLNHFDGFKASRSSKDSYYREEAQKQLDTVMDILMGMAK